LKDGTASAGVKKLSRPELIELLNQDLAREYQAIIAYVVYSQVLKGAEFMNIAGELEKHAAQELSHALIIAKQIDYLGGMPTVEPKTVRTSEKPTRCCSSISKTKLRPFEIIASESANARSWLNMP
jgi:bacterioferritin